MSDDEHLVDAHLGEIISSYLDHELSPAARGDADRHLAACPLCRAELADVASGRAAVRDLPVQWPPAGWLHAVGLGDPRARVRRPATWMVAAAAAAVVALVLPHESRVVPPVPALVDEHATRASVSDDPITQLAPIGVPAGFFR